MKLLFSIISILPSSFIKGHRYFLFFVLYRIVRYRKSVIINNLKNSFPDKSNQEIHLLYKSFLLHFSEFLLEYALMFKADKAFYEKNVQIEGWKSVEDEIKSSNHVVLAMGHQGNWEYAAVRLSQLFDFTMTGIYKKIKNEVVDKAVFDARSKFGLRLFEIKDSVKQILRMREEPAAHLFIMDQSPRRSQSDRWIKFLNQDTLILEGVEKMSGALKAKVFWISVEKVGFGQYQMKLSEIKGDNIMQSCYDQLEKDINKQIHTWLWSHRRWKIKKTS